MSTHVRSSISTEQYFNPLHKEMNQSTESTDGDGCIKAFK